MRWFWTLFYLIIISLLTIVIHADKVILKNKDVIKGKIKKIDNYYLHIKTEFAVMHIKKENISHYIYETGIQKKINVYTRNGKLYSGELLHQDKKTLRIMINKKEYLISKDDIERLDWHNTIFNPEKTYKDLRYASLWRSLLLPSWGQFYQGKKTKGFVIASSMLFFISGTIYAKITVNDYLRRQTSPTFPDSQLEQLEKNISNWDKVYNIFLTASIIGWILNAIDSAVFAPKPHFQSYQLISLLPNSHSGLWGIAITKKF